MAQDLIFLYRVAFHTKMGAQALNRLRALICALLIAIKGAKRACGEKLTLDGFFRL